VKAALIAPKGYETTALWSDIHLALPLLSLRSNMDYLRMLAFARKRGDYIILDNGCAEGQLVTNEELMLFARVIQAHEIVAPDVLDDANKTWELTYKFIENTSGVQDYNIMAVLQGRTVGERMALLESFATINEITALGIPKVTVRQPGSQTRLTTAMAIHNLYPNRFKLHLLGLNEAFPTEMRDVAFPDWIRSMDSAQPYKVTESGQRLSQQAHATRRPDYFENKVEVDMALLKVNIETFRTWAAR
jgi:hypothetical protein